MNLANNEGMTALHRSVSLGSAILTTFLIENGANINRKNKYNQTPFQLANPNREFLNVHLNLAVNLINTNNFISNSNVNLTQSNVNNISQSQKIPRGRSLAQLVFY